MASSKETPRQKMIGMMYLVLTALLALQVSSAMIYKFQALNESLEQTVKETDGRNANRLSDISLEVKERGNRPEEVKLAASAKNIGLKTKEMLVYIEQVKKELIKETGGYDDDGHLKGAKEETKVEVMMIGANKSGKAYELKKRLEEYVVFMNQNSDIKFHQLALDAKDDPLFKNHADQKNKDFAQLNFGQTPLVAGLAILSEIEARVATMEANTLAELSKKIAIGDFKMDKIMPMARPSSKVVAAGTKYDAQLFMAATSSTLKPEMTVGNNSIDVDPNGVGSFSFTASGGNYDAHGNLKKTWTGQIKMKKPDGKDSIYTITEEYIVAKPVIQVQAASVQALYKNCGNKLNIQVPALGNSYNPRISAEGANIIAGANKGFVTVVPTGATVNLKVNSDGNYIGEERFRVKLIPLPTIEIKVNGKKVDPLLGVDHQTMRNISVKAIADRDFAEFLPDDAVYKVTEWKVTLARARNAAAPPKTYKDNEAVSIAELGSNARERDRLIVEIIKVKRKNFRGEWEEVSIGSSVQIIPIN